MPEPDTRQSTRSEERVFDIATVVDALRRIVDGEMVIDPTIVSRLVGRRRRQVPSPTSASGNERSSG